MKVEVGLGGHQGEGLAGIAGLEVEVEGSPRPVGDNDAGGGEVESQGRTHWGEGPIEQEVGTGRGRHR